MSNVDLNVSGDTLTITIDLKARLGLSKSRKTTIVATTNGFTQVPTKPDMSVSLNVVTK